MIREWDAISPNREINKVQCSCMRIQLERDSIDLCIGLGASSLEKGIIII